MEPASPEIHIECQPDSLIATMEDERIVGQDQVRRFKSLTTPLLTQANRKTLILNFPNLRFISSMFLACVIRIHEKVRKNGGKLQLVSPSQNVRNVFKTTHLDQIISIAEAVTSPT